MKRGYPDVTLEQALKFVGKQGWFSQRSREVQKKLAQIAKLRTFERDDLLYIVGDAPNGLLGLVSGSLDISVPRGDGEDYTVFLATTGFWIGNLALCSKDRRLVSIRAAEPAAVVHLPGADVMRLVGETPAIYADLYALSYENTLTLFRTVSNLAILRALTAACWGSSAPRSARMAAPNRNAPARKT